MTGYSVPHKTITIIIIVNLFTVDKCTNYVAKNYHANSCQLCLALYINKNQQ